MMRFNIDDQDYSLTFTSFTNMNNQRIYHGISSGDFSITDFYVFEQ